MKLTLAIFTLTIFTISASAQMRDNRDPQLSCSNNNGFGNGDAVRVCQVQELTLGPSGKLEIEPGHNGGVTVKGWAQNSVAVRARLEAWGRTDADARAVASQVRIETGGGRIQGTGPDTNSVTGWDRQGWSVTFEIFAPWNTDVQTTSHNGGISISDLRGRIEVESHNGGINLTRVAGDIKAESHNGGINVSLEGTALDLRQIDVTTHNGGINLALPASASAHVETKTDRGRIDSEFPIAVRGRLDATDLSFNIGSGGPLIRAVTHNGGIRLRRM